MAYVLRSAEVMMSVQKVKSAALMDVDISVLLQVDMCKLTYIYYNLFYICIYIYETS